MGYQEGKPDLYKLSCSLTLPKKADRLDPGAGNVKYKMLNVKCRSGPSVTNSLGTTCKPPQGKTRMRIHFNLNPIMALRGISN